MQISDIQHFSLWESWHCLSLHFITQRHAPLFWVLLISNIFFFSLIGTKSLLANKTKTVVTITIIIGLSIFFNVSDRTSVIGRFMDDVTPALLDSSDSHSLSGGFL